MCVYEMVLVMFGFYCFGELWLQAWWANNQQVPVVLDKLDLGLDLMWFIPDVSSHRYIVQKTDA